MKNALASLRHWVVNVLWYHYKGRILVAFAVLVSAGAALYASLTSPEPGFLYVLVAKEAKMYAEQAEWLDRTLGELVHQEEDQLPPQCNLINLEDGALDVTRLQVLYKHDNVFLYLAGESALKTLQDSTTDDMWADLTKLGFNPGENIHWIPVSPSVQENFSEPVYVLVKRLKPSREGTVSNERHGWFDWSLECTRFLTEDGEE
ncbi:MAG: hypothetical protein FWH04_06405 [Oscillospiraceae bacterium]|nr:hypothetical protein [Oscillospiraceae bacterium]